MAGLSVAGLGVAGLGADAGGAAAGAVLDAVARAAAPWNAVYADSRAVATAVVFAHLAALVVAGGFALAADRATWRAAAPDAARLAALAEAHRVVGPALAVAVASGALLALADVEAFAASPLFWGKLALVGLLAANGLLMRRTERGLLAAAGEADAPRGAAWGRLRANAAASAVLWFATLLAGTALATG